MTDKLELKSCHEVLYTVDVADVDSIFYCKPTDPDILTVLMKDGKRLYCDEVCPIDSLQEEPVSKDKFTFTSLPRLLDRIKPTDRAKWYSSRLADALEKEGYITDAKIVRESIKIMNGEKVPMATMDEEPVSEDLEEAANEIVNKAIPPLAVKYKDGTYVNRIRDCFERKEFVDLVKAGAKWQKEKLWKPADGNDLPEIDREVVVLIKYNAQRNIHDEEYPTYRVGFGHRPNPDGWDGKDIDTNEVTHYTPKLYDKGGWNAPNIVYWLDARLPYEENKIDKEIEP